MKRDPSISFRLPSKLLNRLDNEVIINGRSIYRSADSRSEIIRKALAQHLHTDNRGEELPTRPLPLTLNR